jgi:hypothetical protein
VGPRAVLNTLKKRRIRSPRRESNRDRPAGNLVVIPTELSRLLTKNTYKLHYSCCCCCCCCSSTFHGFGVLGCCDSELTFEIILNPFRHFVRAPWTGDRPIAMPVPV